MMQKTSSSLTDPYFNPETTALTFTSDKVQDLLNPQISSFGSFEAPIDFDEFQGLDSSTRDLLSSQENELLSEIEDKLKAVRNLNSIEQNGKSSVSEMEEQGLIENSLENETQKKVASDQDIDKKNAEKSLENQGKENSKEIESKQKKVKNAVKKQKKMSTIKEQGKKVLSDAKTLGVVSLASNLGESLAKIDQYETNTEMIRDVTTKTVKSTVVGTTACALARATETITKSGGAAGAVGSTLPILVSDASGTDKAIAIAQTAAVSVAANGSLSILTGATALVDSAKIVFDDKLTKNEKVEEVAKTVVKGGIVYSSTIAGELIGTCLLPGAGTWVGFAIGSFVGGYLGGLIR